MLITCSELYDKLVSSYSGEPYTIINGNKPTFSSYDMSRTTSFVIYRGLDNYRRAGVVLGVIGPDSLEEASDADIGSIHPSGWSSNRYQNIAGSQESNVYNRCHLMARCFGGRNAEENLVTGTDYMNKVGMKHFEEDIVLKYIRETGNHKQKVSAVLKYIDHPNPDIRITVAMTLGMIPTYDSGMALIPLLRDADPMVRASAATAAADIRAKHCEEYVKKLAFADSDPNVRQVAKVAFDRLKDSVV